MRIGQPALSVSCNSVGGTWKYSWSTSVFGASGAMQGKVQKCTSSGIINMFLLPFEQWLKKNKHRASQIYWYHLHHLRCSYQTKQLFLSTSKDTMSWIMSGCVQSDAWEYILEWLFYENLKGANMILQHICLHFQKLFWRESRDSSVSPGKACRS